ncbi:T9SS type A sorting domain-containing protein [Candidatus Thermokryptus mobilis]|uniref:T9SS type A sorting domain-containing protein n=1 Tax=Candidatus Thermokryptus mobilis TaxID=1643428 RepID=UPI0011293302
MSSQFTRKHISLKIYNIEGRIITTLVSSNKKPGTYKIEFNASDLSSGVYFAELTVDRQKEIQKMLLIK